MKDVLVVICCVITTAQLHSTKPAFRFCAGSNPACGMSEIQDGDDLWQCSWLEIRLNAFCWWTIPQKQFINIIIIIIIIIIMAFRRNGKNFLSAIIWRKKVVSVWRREVEEGNILLSKDRNNVIAKNVLSYF